MGGTKQLPPAAAEMLGLGQITDPINTTTTTAKALLLLLLLSVCVCLGIRSCLLRTARQTATAATAAVVTTLLLLLLLHRLCLNLLLHLCVVLLQLLLSGVEVGCVV